MREELTLLRGRDEVAELEEEAEEARAQRLCLSALYAKPPPVWLHPAFAAEFGDAFMAGTALEGGSLSISLEVFVLTLQQMLAEQGTAAPLPHAERAALNSACAVLDDAKKLAHKLAHAAANNGQQRLYLSKVFKSLQKLEPGGFLLLPVLVALQPIFFAVRRGLSPHQHLCTLAVISCEPEQIGHHRASAEPPKLKVQTCLELREVRMDKLQVLLPPRVVYCEILQNRRW